MKTLAEVVVGVGVVEGVKGGGDVINGGVEDESM